MVFQQRPPAFASVSRPGTPRVLTVDLNTSSDCPRRTEATIIPTCEPTRVGDRVNQIHAIPQTGRDIITRARLPGKPWCHLTNCSSPGCRRDLTRTVQPRTLWLGPLGPLPGLAADRPAGFEAGSNTVTSTSVPATGGVCSGWSARHRTFMSAWPIAWGHRPGTPFLRKRPRFFLYPRTRGAWLRPSRWASFCSAPTGALSVATRSFPFRN